MNDELLVSVCMITYNHEDYIKEAISSVLMQKTSFNFELIVSNDCSTDTTDKVINGIIKEYVDNNKIVYSNQPENLGISKNFRFTLDKAKGKYIAILEGDDFWIDAHKLQKQVDFLEAHPEYNLISSEVKEYNQSTKKFIQKTALETSYTINYKNLLEKSHTHTCTLLIRNTITKELPKLFFKEIGCDRQLCLLTLGENGKGFISNDVVAAYRLHSDSISRINGNTGTLKNLNYLFAHIRIAQDWNNYFGNNDNDIVRRVKLKKSKQMLKLILKRKQFQYIPILFKGVFY